MAEKRSDTGKKTAGAKGQPDRAAALKEALRVNLHRRKAQSRARTASDTHLASEDADTKNDQTPR